jgi:hypothetical protein
MIRICMICSFIFLLSNLNYISAQVQSDTTDKDQLILKDNLLPDNQIDVPSKKFLNGKKIDTGLEAGTSFSYSPGNYFGPSFYIAPNVTFYINPRFALQAGIGIERSNYRALYETGTGNGEILPMTRAFIYTRGSYMLNDRLTVSGTVYKTINDVPKLSKYSSSVNYSQTGAIVGINYKINNSLSFGFHVQMINNSSQSENPYFYNPGFGY